MNLEVLVSIYPKSLVKLEECLSDYARRFEVPKPEIEYVHGSPTPSQRLFNIIGDGLTIINSIKHCSAEGHWVVALSCSAEV